MSSSSTGATLVRLARYGGDLRNGMTPEAVDLLWTCTSAEVFELLVQRRGWSLRRFERFAGDFLIGALLESA